VIKSYVYKPKVGVNGPRVPRSIVVLIATVIILIVVFTVILLAGKRYRYSLGPENFSA
jgi:hypothetical protein